MNFVLVFLLFASPQAFESETHSPDFQALLQNPSALQRLTVVYSTLSHKGRVQLFFVRGDG